MSYPNGATSPLLNVLPSSTDSKGYAAIKLAKLAGLECDPWQQDAINALMSVREDGRWACKEYAEIVSRQNGKGSILEARVLAGLFLVNDRLIMWSAHEFKTSTEAFLRVKDLIRVLEDEGHIDPGEIKILSGHGTEEMCFTATRQRIRWIARSKGSSRGFTGDLAIIDEAYAYTKQQDAAIRPTMSARPNAQMIYTSTPPLDGVTGEVLYKVRNRALNGTSPRLGYRDWAALPPTVTLDDVGKVDRETNKLIIDLADHSLWVKSNPAMTGPRGLPDLESIEDELDAMGAEEFARERLGIWPKEFAEGGGAIDRDAWNRLLNGESARTGECAIAIDISPKRDSGSVGLYGDGVNGLGHMQLVNFDYGTAWIIDQMIKLRDKVKPVAWSMSRSTYASLEKMLIDNNFKVPYRKDGEIVYSHGDVLVMDGTDTAAACGHIIDAVRDGTMLVRPDAKAPQILNNAVTGAVLREGLDAVTWSRKDSRTDITPLVAVTYARWAFITQKDRLHQEDAVFGSWS